MLGQIQHVCPFKCCRSQLYLPITTVSARISKFRSEQAWKYIYSQLTGAGHLPTKHSCRREQICPWQIVHANRPVIHLTKITNWRYILILEWNVRLCQLKAMPPPQTLIHKDVPANTKCWSVTSFLNDGKRTQAMIPTWKSLN